MQFKKRLSFGSILLLLYFGAVSTVLANSQPVSTDTPQSPDSQQCGTITSPEQLQYPIDRRDFFLINPFSRPSTRFDGRLHTGDDWVRLQGETLGEPVYSIGPGRVTYSNPLGWGRDKGVIITEHVMANGFTLYALYGHVEERNDITFPSVGNCVNTGDVLAVIGDPRPAPHLHFEIRIFDPFEPGPGYWPIDPQLEGWLNPSQFLDNWIGWLHPAHRWHVVAGNADGVIPPPVLLDDNSLVYVDDVYLNYVDADGNLSRQYRMADSVEAIGLANTTDGQLMATRDGRLIVWSSRDGLVGQWGIERDDIVGGPYVLADLVWLGAANGDVIVLNNAQRAILTTYTDAGQIQRVAINSHVLALLTAKDTVLIFDRQGDLIDSFEVERNSDILATPNGIIIRDGGNLVVWQDGTRQPLIEGYTVNRTDSQMALAGDHILVWGWDGPTRLAAIDLSGEVQWQTDLVSISGQDVTRAALQPINRCTSALLSPQGVLLLFDHRNGQIVGNVTLWGQNRTRVWIAPHAEDGLLRFQVVDQIAAYALDALSVNSSAYCK